MGCVALGRGLVSKDRSPRVWSEAGVVWNFLAGIYGLFCRGLGKEVNCRALCCCIFVFVLCVAGLLAQKYRSTTGRDGMTVLGVGLSR